ncbi:MAG: cupin domain-containing protein [Paracoccaceae bacterium]|nr:cupin domain-containing protein [Paracoccaceae bacterium]
MPKIPIPGPVTVEDTSHPVLGATLGLYSYRPLGDAAGLTQFGAHLETLPPGSRSSHRHWHEAEDELVYMLAGEIVLIEDEETALRAGEAAAWPAGATVGHCLENRSGADATYLVVGTRKMADVVHYPDAGLTLTITDRRRRVFTDRAGRVVADYER